MGLLAITAVTWFVAVGALSVVILVLIVAAPWRRIRAESRRLDPDVETRLLLGEDPDKLADELDRRVAAQARVAKLRPDQRP
jgi:hypothetical protein